MHLLDYPVVAPLLLSWIEVPSLIHNRYPYMSGFFSASFNWKKRGAVFHSLIPTFIPLPLWKFSGEVESAWSQLIKHTEPAVFSFLTYSLDVCNFLDNCFIMNLASSKAIKSIF